MPSKRKGGGVPAARSGKKLNAGGTRTAAVRQVVRVLSPPALPFPPSYPTHNCAKAQHVGLRRNPPGRQYQSQTCKL